MSSNLDLLVFKSPENVPKPQKIAETFSQSHTQNENLPPPPYLAIPIFFSSEENSV